MLRLLITSKSRLLILLCLTALVATGLLAQDTTDRLLVPGESVTGAIDANNPAQVYTFTADAGATVTLTAASEDGLALTLLLTDVEGNQLGQVVGAADEPEIVLDDLELSEAGTYYITVFPSSGADAAATGTFELTFDLSGPTPEPTVIVTETPTPAPSVPETFEPGQVVLSNGIQIGLTWNTRDDLNLQVRDPVGGTLYWDSRTTDFGGEFGPDVNGLCEVLADPPAVETASWPGGALATGSYEILVFYRQACEGNEPVDFTVDITVDQTPLEPIEGTLLPPVDNEANVFLSSFTVNPDGTASNGASGPAPAIRELPVPAQQLLEEDSVPVQLDDPVTGLITNEQPWETYTFEGLEGQLIAVSISATSGSLDTLLLILNSAGNVVGANDDIQIAVNTDSAINGLRLPSDDVYTILATRYGKDVGGTEGNYELVVSSTQIPQQLLDLDLPSGDIEITLTWETDADLQLLVRDPSGNSVYDDVPRVPSGGQLTAQGNVNCTVSEGSPVSYIYWPDGFLRIGSYEVEVWYQSECGDPRPVVFTIYIVVEGELVFTDTQQIEFQQTYLTSFNIDQTGQAMASNGGIIGGSETLNYETELASALRISPGQTVSGSITPNNKFDLYVFEGNAGDVVTISMTATSDTLDTQLFLIDPNGVEIASNDDANETTNSLISAEGLLLNQNGQYTIIATHYGAAYGGTVGGYNLSLRVDN